MDSGAKKEKKIGSKSFFCQLLVNLYVFNMSCPPFLFCLEKNLSLLCGMRKGDICPDMQSTRQHLEIQLLHRNFYGPTFTLIPRHSYCQPVCCLFRGNSSVSLIASQLSSVFLHCCLGFNILELVELIITPHSAFQYPNFVTIVSFSVIFVFDSSFSGVQEE